MAIIRVPGPPPEAFRKNRPISDLIKSQIRHFQHLEHKLQLVLPTKFLPNDLTTEAAAAQYIAEITTALRNRATTSQQAPAPIHLVPSPNPDSTPAPKSAPEPIRKPTPISPRKRARKPQGIPIAAAATPTPSTPKKSRRKKHALAKHTKKKKS